MAVDFCVLFLLLLTPYLSSPSQFLFWVTLWDPKHKTGLPQGPSGVELIVRV